MAGVDAHRRGPWAWAAIVVPLWIVLALCVHWEPIVRDAWGNLNFHRWNKLGLASTWHLLRDGWLGSNPRLGQVVTTMLYAPGPYHVVLTPLFELGLFYVMAALVIARWPSLRRTDDALMFGTVIAIFALCTPQFGPMLFYRPFTGNYMFGLGLSLLWLVPYRFHADAPRHARGWWAPALLLLGAAAGMCNEHTGPAFLLAGGLAIMWSVRRGDRLQTWMIAGLVGLAAGYVLLMLAPGHAARYGGLAKQAGMIERVLDRGIAGDLRVVAMLLVYLLWSLPWILVGVVVHRSAQRERTLSGSQMSSNQRAACIALLAAGVLATLALLASPKLGPRLYVHSVALIAIAMTAWLSTQVTTSAARKACAILSGIALVYVAFRCVNTYRIVGPVSAQRLELLRKGEGHGENIVVPRYPIAAGKWFLGEDFTAENLRASTAADYGLGSISLAPDR